VKVHFPGRILDRHVGGNTTYTRKIAEGLAARGIDIASLPFSARPAGTMLLESIAPLRIPRQGNVIHYSADTGPLVRLGRTPSVVTVHGVASRWISTARNRWQEKIWRTRVSRAIECTGRVITVSESSADDVSAVFGLPRDRIAVIPHGIDVEKYAAPQMISSEVRRRLPSQYLLYVGNIEPRKNLGPLLEAVEAPEFKRLGLPLVIAGKPAWNYDDLMARIGSATNVIYLGFVSEEDKIALMQNAHLFVFPSLYEGFGFPVLEAMAGGTPVLTSQRGSLKEVGGPSLKLLGEVLDRECILRGLLDSLGDSSRLQASADQGREWASHFSWDASIDAHIRIYEELLR